jgi:hypothetical protein
MKLELVKKTEADGYVCYYIMQDGRYVSGSNCGGADGLTRVMTIFENLKTSAIIPKEEVIMVEVV